MTNVLLLHSMLDSVPWTNLIMFFLYGFHVYNIKIINSIKRFLKSSQTKCGDKYDVQLISANISKCFRTNYVFPKDKQCPTQNLKILVWEHHSFVKQTFKTPDAETYVYIGT